MGKVFLHNSSHTLKFAFSLLQLDVLDRCGTCWRGIWICQNTKQLNKNLSYRSLACHDMCSCCHLHRIRAIYTLDLFLNCHGYHSAQHGIYAAHIITFPSYTTPMFRITLTVHCACTGTAECLGSGNLRNVCDCHDRSWFSVRIRPFSILDEPFRHYLT